MSGDTKQIDHPLAAASALPDAHPTPSPFFTCDLKRILCVAALAIASLVGILALARVNGLAQMGNAGGGALLGGGVFFLLIALWVSRTKEKAKEDPSGSVVKPNADALHKFFDAFYVHMCDAILAPLPQNIAITRARLWVSISDGSDTSSFVPMDLVASPADPLNKSTVKDMLKYKLTPESGKATVEAVLVVRDTASKFHLVRYSNTLSYQEGPEGSVQRYSDNEVCDEYRDRDAAGLKEVFDVIKPKLKQIESASYGALPPEFTR